MRMTAGAPWWMKCASRHFGGPKTIRASRENPTPSLGMPMKF
jgi:hypothetical protein